MPESKKAPTQTTRFGIFDAAAVVGLCGIIAAAVDLVWEPLVVSTAVFLVGVGGILLRAKSRSLDVR